MMKINYKTLCGAAALAMAAGFFVAHAQTAADDMQALLQKQLQALGGNPLQAFGGGQIPLTPPASSTDSINKLSAQNQILLHMLQEVQAGGSNSISQVLQELKRAKASGIMNGADTDSMIKELGQIQAMQQLEQQSRLGGALPAGISPPSANCPDAKTLKDLFALKENDYQLLITWKTIGLVPPVFPGKILPTTGSEISASFEILRNGKIMNPGGQTVGGKLLGSSVNYWYINDNLINNSQGKQTVTFTLPVRTTAPDTLTMQLQLPQYKEYPLCEQEPEKFIFQTVNIPLVSPEAVIEAPYASGNIFGAAKVKAAPYFFNASDASKLSYVWSVNGETSPGAEDPTSLTVNINPEAPSGSTINIALAIQDPFNPALLTGAGNVSLNYFR